MVKKLDIHTPSAKYPIYLGSKIYEQLPSLLKDAGVTPDQKMMLITDSHLAPLYGHQVRKILQNEGFQVGFSVIPAGESSKNLRQVEQCIGECLQFGLDRRSLILALGGGVVGDLAGFVAATYMRGIPFVQLPTTLLAHDSSVGGKVGVNHRLAKNYIGAFHQPLMVVFEMDVLQTLPERQLYSGFAEVIKHALIWDRSFAEWLYQSKQPLIERNSEYLQEAIYRGCQVKANVVSQDEKEYGIRAILNYGHTIGHALEAVSHYQVYTHGEAVSIGMAGAVRLSQKRYGFPFEWVKWTEELLSAYHLPIRFEQDWSQEALLAAMKRDKKAKKDEYTFVLAKAIGEVEIVRGIPEEEIKLVLEQLRGGSE